MDNFWLINSTTTCACRRYTTETYNTNTLAQTQKHIQIAPSVFEVDFAVSFYVYVSALIWWFFVCVYTPKSILCSEWHFRTTYFEARSLSSMGTHKPTDRPCAKSYATQHIHFSDSICGQTEIDKYSFRVVDENERKCDPSMIRMRRR